jgi:hypothetical protein
LELWAISRQLPFSGRVAVLAELASPVLGTILLLWLAIVVGSALGFSPPAYFILLAPAAISSIVLAAVYDILRKSRGSELLAGHVADSGAIGLLLGALLAGIPLLIVPWLTDKISSSWVNLIIVMIGFAFSLSVASLMWGLAASVYRGIK